MRSRSGPTQWRRLAVVPLLVVLILLGADVALDDNWIDGVHDAADNGVAFLRAASRGVVGPGPAIAAPVPVRSARLLVRADASLSSWIVVVTPSDRAPPRV